jgi:5-methylcytosine-specific restriction endonuclease McrA
MSRWWRAYDAALDNPKLQRLPGELFKTWFNVCCVASKHGGKLPRLADAAFLLRMKEKDTALALAALMSAGLLDKDGDSYSPHDWNVHQYKTDNGSNERVKRYRQKRTEAGLVAQWQPSAELRQAVYAANDFSCVYCGSGDDLTVDHKVPEMHGGTHDRGNLQTACRACNAKKRDLTHDEYVTRCNGAVTAEQHPQKQRTETESSVAIATDGKPSSGEVGKIVVRPMPDVALPEEPLSESARERLWRVGKPALMTLGVPQAKCGQMMGLWLKDSGDNHDRVLGAILRAHEMAPMDPIPWITASLKQDKPNGKAGSIHAAAEELVAWTREREAASRSEAPALLTDVRG